MRQANRVSTAPASGLRAIDPLQFRLRHEPVDVPDGSGLEAVELDRRVRPFGRGLRAPLAARLASGLRGGFRWDAEDSRSKDWYPQGDDGRGHRLLVSWYSKSSGAARLSVVDTDAGRYGHVALVGADGSPVRTHAGGLAWRGARRGIGEDAKPEAGTLPDASQEEPIATALAMDPVRPNSATACSA